MTSPVQSPVSLKQPLLWVAFLLYLLVAAFTLVNHEMWADELHSWNIAKGSESFSDIFRNSRYEGHPPLWYIILWTIAQFTHDLAAVQAVHLLMAAVPVFLILFYSKIPVATRLLMPFGYFFLFEYAVLSRNYAIGILLACLVCLVIRRNFRYKTVLYYTLLLLLANTHLLGTLLAGSLHVYFLIWQMQQKRSAGIIVGHVLLGILVALPAVYFILPPSDSVLNAQVQTGNRFVPRAKAFMQAPLRSMLPMPAWWRYNWWNTQLLVDVKESAAIIRLLSLAVAIAVPVLAFFILRNERKSLALFFANFFFSLVIALTVLTLGTARYSGFIFIGFVLALWLYCEEKPLIAWKKMVINTMLGVQAMAGMFAVVKDIQSPFSNSYRVQELIQQVPAGKKLVCDYWAVNTYSAYVDEPVYCIDLQKEADMVLFDNYLRQKLRSKYRYLEGINYFDNTTGTRSFYMLSTHSPATLSAIDPFLQSEFQVRLVDKREGAIEKFSNLYLYEISFKK
jgi:hypothetical protein